MGNPIFSRNVNEEEKKSVFKNTWDLQLMKLSYNFDVIHNINMRVKRIV